MNIELTIPERLIVAADYDPRKLRLDGAYNSLMSLANSLRDTGVTIKVNSLLRACGYTLIDELHSRGLNVFADLKLKDIPKTMELDAGFLSYYKPKFLTVMCDAGVAGIRIVQEILPETNVLGVTVLTSIDDDMSDRIYHRPPEIAVIDLAHIAQDAGLKGLILSPKELLPISKEIGLNLDLYTPGIRPKWSIVPGDDQVRVMTPFQAIKDGAMGIVVGRPITQAKKPRDAVKRTLEEMEKGLEAR